MKNIKYFVLLFVLTNFIPKDFNLYAIDVTRDVKNKLEKTQAPAIRDAKKFDINHISAWFYNDGEFYSDKITTGPGFEWPKGSGIYAIFSSGLWIGAKVLIDTIKEIRVATVGHFGSEYRPGRILPDGTPEDFNLPHLKIYQVKPLIDSPTSNPDYLNWPVDQGAPWIDIDKDNVWNPYIDKIGIALRTDTLYPDLVQFCVFNDADSLYHNWIWGRSKPLGVEVRQTVWAFKNTFPDVNFIKYQIYNKSNKILDSTFFSLWSDPDLGDAFDDNVGCDTSTGVFNKKHNLGYCYNGDNDDGTYGYGNRPPAVAFKLLQGPVVPSSESDTAFAFGKIFYGYRNLDLSSFIIYCNPGQGGCTNPDWYDPNLYEQSYNIMNGLTRIGKPWVDPHTGDTVKFVFAGDPVTGQGFIQNNLLSPGDMRHTMTTGPLTMAPGDSQEIVYASLISRGIDHLNSIIKLRQLSNKLNYFIFQPDKIPNVTVLFPNIYQPPFLLKVKVEGALGITAIVYNKNGELLTTSELYDDGLHDDSLNNDNIWANWINPPIDSTAVSISLVINYNDNTEQIWDNVVTNITLMGRISVDSLTILSDNVNKDNLPNPGENIRLKVLLKNGTNFIVRQAGISISYALDSISTILTTNTFSIDSIHSGASIYVPSDDYYFSVNILPDAIPGKEIKLVFSIYDINENYWEDTLKFTVMPYTYQPVDTVATQISGNSEGKFRILLVDHSQLKANEYEISIRKVPHIKMNLVNLTTNDTLLKLFDLPDPDGHNIPVIDGFRVMIGNVYTITGVKTVNYFPSYNKWFTRSNKYYVTIPAFGITYPTNNNFIFKNSAIPAEELKIVEIRFSEINTQKAYRYLSGFAPFPPSMRVVKHPEFRPFVIDSVGSGFIYQDYEKYPLGNSAYGRTVPFTVWEIDSRTGVERQLNIAIVENNDSLYRIVDGNYQYIGRGNIDGKWWPTHAQNGGEELVVIFSSTYNEQADTFYTKRNLKLNFEEFDVYYIFSPKLNDSTSKYLEGDILRIVPYFPITEKDKFRFNPLKLLDSKIEDEQLTEYKLFNCYPNPFNFRTNIKFYSRKSGKLTLEIYNILGQKVRTLFEDHIEPGTYSLSWDGNDNRGRALPSGVYFIKMRIHQFSKVIKVILLK